MVLRNEAGSPLGMLVWAEITFRDRSGPKARLYQASSENETRSFIEGIFLISADSYRLQSLDWQCLPVDAEPNVIPIVAIAVTP